MAWPKQGRVRGWHKFIRTEDRFCEENMKLRTNAQHGLPTTASSHILLTQEETTVPHQSARNAIAFYPLYLAEAY